MRADEGDYDVGMVDEELLAREGVKAVGVIAFGIGPALLHLG